MPAKKKSRRKRTPLKSKPTRKKTASRKGAAKTRVSPKRKAKKAKISSRRATPAKKATLNAASEIEREIRGEKLARADAASTQSDFLGLSRKEEADSESVDELVEEGNVFEAGAIKGVEEADSKDESEVHTHEVPEDDVPEEYLEEDQG